jgi:hypothetical protein
MGEEEFFEGTPEDLISKRKLHRPIPEQGISARDAHTGKWP